MKTIEQELRNAIQAVADNYGVIIKRLSVDWLNVSDLNEARFVVSKIETSDSLFIDRKEVK